MPYLPNDFRERVQKLLTSHDTYATTLIALVLDRYGTECLSWAPATLADELHDDFDVVLPEIALAKLAAANVLLTSNRFFKHLGTYIQICNILSDDLPQPQSVNLADAAECAWGTTEALLIYPPDEDEPFTDEIRWYLGQVLDQEGVDDPPDLLRLALRDPRQSPPTDAADWRDAIQQTQLARRDSLSRMIADNLRELLEELESLPLEHGDPRGLAAKLGRGLIPTR